MEINFLRELVTVVSFVTFLGIVAYAVHPRNKARFDAAAWAALNDGDPSPRPSPRGEGEKHE